MVFNGALLCIGENECFIMRSLVLPHDDTREEISVGYILLY